MTDDVIQYTTSTYRAREAVGLFADPDRLEDAIEALEEAGFDRAAISILASDARVRERIGHLYRSSAEAAEDPRAPQATFTSRHDRAELEAFAVGIPFQVGGFAGAYAVVAAGGALAAAIAGTILGGAIAGGIGALIALAVAHRHAQHVREQLAKGGIVLWVAAPDPAAGDRAVKILQDFGADAVHVHAIEREWGVKDLPFHDAQPDPLLFDRDPPLR
jgi:hypothetical protein